MVCAYLFLVFNLLIFHCGGSYENCPNLKFLQGVHWACIKLPDSNLTDYTNVVINDYINDQIIVNPATSISVKIALIKTNLNENVYIQAADTALPNQMVGIAIDGIPIYSAMLSAGGIDVVSTEALGKIDKCGGMYGETIDGPRYHS